MTDGVHTGWAAWLKQDLSGQAETSGVNNYWWNITQFKDSPASPWWSSNPTYIYFTGNPAAPNAQYISETVPPGTQEAAGTAFTEVVTMKNTGTTTWTNGINGYTLNLMSTPQFGESGSPIYATLNQTSVTPGNTGTFTLNLTAPMTPNTYTETWRMKSSVGDGNVAFGDTVTVQIVVPTPQLVPNAQYISETVPPGTQEAAGTAFTEVVTMKNTGTTTWTNGINGYTLNLMSTPQFGESGSPIYATLNQTSVTPGNTGTFTLNLTAPMTPNTYTETWRMKSSVGDGNVAFGDTVTVQIVVPTPQLVPNAQYISETVPPGTQEAAGTAFTEVVTMKNTGTTTWTNGINGYTLNLMSTPQFGESGSPIYATLNQTSVTPGNTGTFTLNLTAPMTPNTYTETWRMKSSVGDGNVAFGDTVTVQIVVPTPQLVPNAQYISETVPPGTQEAAGTAFTEVVTMKNTGTTTWTNGINGYTLNLMSTPQFGESGSPIYATLNQTSVTPGNTGTFTLNLTAPMTPNTYTETWRMKSSVGDGNVAFGDTVTVQIVVQGSITDQQKQNDMLTIVNNHQGALPAEFVLAEIFQEGGRGAFYVDGYDYNSFYSSADGPWAQPSNGDGIMQNAVAYHEASGSYTNDQTGYDHSIDDGCHYLKDNYTTYGTLWQAALHYNTGPNSLYIYKNDMGDTQYLNHVASALQSFVPPMFGLSNADLVSKLQAAQQIVSSYLNNSNIASGQPASYYTTFQVQLDNDLYALSQMVNPVLTVSTTSLTLPATTQGTAGGRMSFTISGSNLGSGDTVTLSAPVGGEISLSSSSGFGAAVSMNPTSGGTLSTTTVYARISASATSNVSGYIIITDANHSSLNKSIPVSGTVNSATTGTISGTVWNDSDGDGVKEPGETPLSGWWVELNTGMLVTSASDGTYTFTGVSPGTYTVFEDMKTGWQQTAPSGGTYSVTIAAGQNVTTKDFGNISTSTSPMLNVSTPAAITEGNTGSKNLTFTVTLSASSAQTVTVNYATSNGTATAGSDYTATSNTLTFTSGQTSKQINVPILGDYAIEGDETFTMMLSAAANATIGTDMATGTIQNDDVAGTLALSSSTYSVNENAGTVTVMVNRTGGLASGVGINYATSNGTATAGSDFTSTSAMLTFGGGETSKTFTVPITNDSVPEGNETFNVTLSSTTGGGSVGTPSSAVITIVDVAGQQQEVTGTAQTTTAIAGQAISIPIRYTVSDNDNTLAGLGLRIHYDSHFMTFNSLGSVLPNGLVSQQTPADDLADYDGDPNTDKYVLVAWADTGGNWPNVAIPMQLLVANFTLAGGLANGSQSMVQFSASSTAPSYGFESQPITVNVATTSLDVDGNGQCDALTDGILAMRYLFDPSGPWTTTGAIGTGATQTTHDAVKTYLDGATGMLDVDGNGHCDALTDGILMMRYLFDPTGPWTTTGAIGSGATRTTHDQVKDFLDQYFMSQSAQQSFGLSAMQAPSLLVSELADPVQNQIVTPSATDLSVNPGDDVTFDVNYNTDPVNPTLAGLGLRMYYNSSVLTFNGLSGVFATGKYSGPYTGDDTTDTDGDPNTDKYVFVGWADPSDNWPGEIPHKLFTADFTLNADAKTSTQIGFGATSVSPTWNLTPLR